MKDILLHVEGMECTGCENRIQNALKDRDGVKEVVVAPRNLSWSVWNISSNVPSSNPAQWI